MGRALSFSEGADAFAKSLALIDAGTFPLSVIRETSGLPAMTMKTLSDTITSANFVGLAAERELPEAWFHDLHGDNILDEMLYGLLSMHVMELSRVDGVALSHAKAANDKQAIRKIGNKWTWLSQRKDMVGADEALRQCSKKYKYTSEMQDSLSIVRDLVQGVVLRAMMELPNVDNDCVRADFIDGLFVEVQPDAVFDQFEAFASGDLKKDYLSMSVTEDVSDALLKTAPTIPSLGRMSRRLHTNISKITQTLGGYEKNETKFESVTEKTVEFKDFDFVPLDTSRKLLNEGENQAHCVYTYLGQCLSGECAIVSMRDKRGETIATIDLRHDGGEGVELESALGYDNATISDEHCGIIEQYIDKINAHPGMVRSFWYQSNEELDDLLNTPATKFSTLSSLSLVPFETDAAYYACELIEKFVPGGMDALFMPDSFLNNMIKATPFGQTLTQTREVAANTGMSFMQSLAHLRDGPENKREGDTREVEALRR